MEQFRNDPSLVAYYPFDNEAEAPDRLLNRAATTAGRLDGVLGEEGVPDTRPTWADGHRPDRRALRFDMARRQTVRVPYDDALNIGAELTVVARIKPTLPLPPHSCVIVCHHDGSKTLAFRRNL